MNFQFSLSRFLRSVSVSMDNDVQWDDSWVIRSTDGRFPRKVFLGERTIDLELELLFEDTNMLKRFFNGVNAQEPSTSYTPFETTITMGNSTGSMTILIPKTYIEEDSIDMSGLDLLLEGVTAHALHDPTINGAIKFTLVNSKQNYTS
ncbi:MAG: phage tail tube protein [Candidatus Jordarchaeales archaeon]